MHVLGCYLSWAIETLLAIVEVICIPFKNTPAWYIFCVLDIRITSMAMGIVWREALNLGMRLQARAACVSNISCVCGSCCKHMDVLASFTQHEHPSRAACDCPAWRAVDPLHGAWHAGMHNRSLHNALFLRHHHGL